MKIKLIILFSFLCTSSSILAIETKTIEYKDGDTLLEGFIAYPDKKSKAPGVLIVHQWKGLTDYEMDRARMLAELGYVAFAVDIYGKGVRAKNSEEAGKLASTYRSNRKLLRQRVAAAHKALLRDPRVAQDKTAAIGYCFGGGAVLEFARSGARLSGVISFHGNLDTPNPNDARQIKTKVLVLHGAADPHVPSDQVLAFQKEMEEAGVDWHLVSYGHAVHSFTMKSAGNDPSEGSAYNAQADRRSWQEMQNFFKEIF